MSRPDTLSTDDCLFCDLLIEPSNAFDVTEQVGAGNISVVPALGMILPGYLLTITDEHVTSFGQLTGNQLTEIDATTSEVESRLTPLFGRYFRIEHGMSSLTECGTGGCVDHAHQHLIPADDDAGADILEQLPWQQLDCFEDLAEFGETPYIYLGRTASHYILPNPKLPGQWARRRVAAVRSLATYDWAIDVGNKELSETYRILRANPVGFHNFETHELVDDHIAKYATGPTSE